MTTPAPATACPGSDVVRSRIPGVSAAAHSGEGDVADGRGGKGAHARPAHSGGARGGELAGRHDAHRHTGLSVVDHHQARGGGQAPRRVVGEDADPLAAEKSPLGPRSGHRVGEAAGDGVHCRFGRHLRVPRCQGNQRRGHEVDALGRRGQQEADVVVVEEAHARKPTADKVRASESMSFRGPLDQNRGPGRRSHYCGCALHFYPPGARARNGPNGWFPGWSRRRAEWRALPAAVRAPVARGASDG